MKETKKLILLIVLTVAIQAVQAQKLVIGGTGSIGLSKITNIKDIIIGGGFDPINSGNITASINAIDYDDVEFLSSGNLGLFVEGKIGLKSKLVLESTFSKISGKGLNPNTFYSNEIKINTNYLTMSLMYKYEVGKLGINTGIQTMLLLFGDITFSQTNIASNQTNTNTLEIMEFRKLDLGAKLVVDYSIGENVRLKAAYFHGFRNMDEVFSFERFMNRQLVLGVDYLFWRKH